MEDLTNFNMLGGIDSHDDDISLMQMMLHDPETLKMDKINAFNLNAFAKAEMTSKLQNFAPNPIKFFDISKNIESI